MVGDARGLPNDDMGEEGGGVGMGIVVQRGRGEECEMERRMEIAMES